jgi:AcrR family transcriptional regulator
MASRVAPDRPPTADTLSGPKAARTREMLVATAKAEFLARGYVDTSVEHITEAAQVSRPTFYTYFRSKREIFDAVALTTSVAAERVFDGLGGLGPDWTTDDLVEWVRSYFAYVELHGPWVLVWHEARRTDHGVLDSGRASRRYHARRIGIHLRNLGVKTEQDPVDDGLIVLAILEALGVDGRGTEGARPEAIDITADAIAAFLRRP